MRPLHLMTQDDQPYGSQRHCCERCGLMLGFANSETWTDERDTYDSPSDGYEPCGKRSQ
jgi:hypothetical protein